MAFDWDNIDCASPNLENSAYFFSVRHVEHEKDYVEKQLGKHQSKENSENISENIKDVARIVAKELAAKKEPASKKTPSRIPLRTRMNLHQGAPKNFTKIVPRKSVILQEKVKPPVAQKKPPSRIPQWNVQKNKPPIREEKKIKIPPKENAVKFKAKPAPNFKIIHEQQQKKTVKPPPIVTIPQTPIVLRKSQKMQPKPRILPVKPAVKKLPLPPVKKPPAAAPVVKATLALKKEPTRPKKTTTVVPFNLQTTRRFEERRQFDDMMRQMRDLKIQKDAAMKRQHENNLRKEIRKKTEFRARPNPFK